MTPRAPNSEAEGGFIIIEVLVSALILAIVAGAVLTLITATTRGAAAQRDRSVAYDLAQADQARLRTLKLTEINGVEKQESQATSNGTEYAVTSERVYVNNKAGAVSCAQGTETPDYVQLTSTVSSPTMLHPVVLQSVVSPSTGSLNPTYGTLDLTAANALGGPVPGVRITLTGGRSALTGTEGCAIFPSLPKGKYTATYEGQNLVDEDGRSATPQEVEVVAGEVERPKTVNLDRPAELSAEFVYVEPSTGKTIPAAVDSMSVANATSGKPSRVFLPAGGAPRGNVFVAGAIYPYASPSEYTVYAGSCPSNNPGAASTNGVGFYSAVVPPGSHLTTPPLHVPALELNLTTATGAPAVGATVVLTDTSILCKSGSTGLKRTFKTNTEGHLGSTEAGIPFGTYNLCASLKVGTSYQTASKSGVKIEDFTNGTTLPLKLASTGGGECK